MDHLSRRAWKGLERIPQREVGSGGEKQMPHFNAYMWDLGAACTDEPVSKNTDADAEEGCADERWAAPGRGHAGVIAASPSVEVPWSCLRPRRPGLGLRDDRGRCGVRKGGQRGGAVCTCRGLCGVAGRLYLRFFLGLHSLPWALQEIHAACLSWSLRRRLDLGSGPAPSAYALRSPPSPLSSPLQRSFFFRFSHA